MPEPIALGVNTDAYQPVERDLRLTRRVIEVLHEREHPFAAITKSSLIERDIDLLAPMAARGQVMAAITITTLDADHRAHARAARGHAVAAAAHHPHAERGGHSGRRQHRAGDSVRHRAGYGARAGSLRARPARASASYIVLRLPWEVAPLFKDWLAAHFPDRAERVMGRVRDMRGGKDYDSTFSDAHEGRGPVGGSAQAAIPQGDEAASA